MSNVFISESRIAGIYSKLHLLFALLINLSLILLISMLAEFHAAYLLWVFVVFYVTVFFFLLPHHKCNLIFGLANFHIILTKYYSVLLFLNYGVHIVFFTFVFSVFNVAGWSACLSSMEKFCFT